MSMAEDIDENASGIDDEDLDDSGLRDDDLSERRRRHGVRVRGRNYAPSRADGSAVNQTQMQAALARVAEDVRKLATGQRAQDERLSAGLKRLRGDTQQASQMAALLPLLFKPKTKALTELTVTDKVMVDSNDSMSMLLPLMLMGGMGGSSTAGGGDNMMMMMVMMMAMGKK